MIKLEERGNCYYRLLNEKKELFFLFTHEPAWYWKIVFAYNYVVCNQKDIDLLEIIIIQSNDGTLTRKFWFENYQKFGTLLVDYLRRNLKFKTKYTVTPQANDTNL